MVTIHHYKYSHSWCLVNKLLWIHHWLVARQAKLTTLSILLMSLGFDVAKTGDARVGFVGKFIQLSKLLKYA